MEEGNQIYNNLQLEDLENEIWIDVIGFDGVYAVSNLGRFKSLRREVSTRWGTPRIVEERILKQSIRKIKSGRIDGLTVHLGVSKNPPRVIFESFYPDVDFSENECVMHINKNPLDNRLINLQKVTWKKSKATDMVKSKRTIVATSVNIRKAIEAQKEFYDNRTHKQCSECGKIDLVENFHKGVSRCQKCINDYYIEKRKNYKYGDGIKECTRCEKEKKDDEFPKYDSICKKCRYELHRDYQIEQKENLGDFYVKEYGKRNYGIRNFTKNVMDRLREELKEKRKPRHIYDGKSFRTTNEFAEYVFSKYKISVAAVKRRISQGMTEYECTLSRKQLLGHNLNKT
jgi:uncharacterized protein (DUF983 family)